MIDALKRWLDGGEPPADDPAEAARTAVAALLVEVAMADGVYTPREAEHIARVLQESFALDASVAAALIAEARSVVEEAVDHHRFTRVVKTLPLDERVSVVEGLWRVAFADDDECAFEEALIRKLADLLHVPPREARLARQRVQA